MRKGIVGLMLALALLIFCVPAMAETYVFDSIYASVEMPEGYTVLTPATLPGLEKWLEGKGTTLQAAQSDFEARGVLLQAWTEAGDACFEIRANQDDRTKLIFDVNEQAEDIRRSYRMLHYPDNTIAGYDFSTSEWKNTAAGRFLVLRYIRRDSGEILYRGFMRRTIRNGYEIDFDMQIRGRAVTNKDNTALNKIWETFRFIEVHPLPAAAACKINITKNPPEETNEQNFNIEGTAAEGVKLTAVTMGLSSPDPVLAEVTVGKNGKFALPIRLPKEGVFLITVTGEYQGEDVVEMAFPVTYQRTMLAVNFSTKPESVVTEDTVTFAGKGEPGASIQVFLDNEPILTKRVNTAGRFTVDMKVEEEGSHEVILVFGKKGLADRRFVFTFSRKWSDADMMKYLSKQAAAPTYSQLNKNIEKYEGRIVGYRAYLVDVSSTGEEYVYTMALSRKNKKYSNYILVTAPQSPSFEIGDRVMMYGTCEGMSLSTGGTEDEGEEASYPCFSLLMLSSLE